MEGGIEKPKRKKKKIEKKVGGEERKKRRKADNDESDRVYYFSYEVSHWRFLLFSLFIYLFVNMHAHEDENHM